MLFILIGISLVLGISSASSSDKDILDLSTHQELNEAMLSAVRRRLSPAHRLLMEEDISHKTAVEALLSHAIAEALVLKAARVQKEKRENITKWHQEHPIRPEHIKHTEPSSTDNTAETVDTSQNDLHHHLNDDEFIALAAKWAKKFDDLKAAHDAKKKAEHEGEKYTGQQLKDIVAKWTKSVHPEVAEPETTATPKTKENGPVVLVKDFPDINQSPSDQLTDEVANDALNADDPNADNVDTRHIVVNFSTESLMNLWAIVGMILIINVILYCCYTRRKAAGRAYLGRNDLSPDDV